MQTGTRQSPIPPRVKFWGVSVCFGRFDEFRGVLAGLLFWVFFFFFSTLLLRPFFFFFLFSAQLSLCLYTSSPPALLCVIPFFFFSPLILSRSFFFFFFVFPTEALSDSLPFLFFVFFPFFFGLSAIHVFYFLFSACDLTPQSTRFDQCFKFAPINPAVRKFLHCTFLFSSNFPNVHTIQFFYFTLWDEFYSFDLFIYLLS